MSTLTLTIIIVAFTLISGLVVLFFLFPGTVTKLLLRAERNRSGLTEQDIHVNGLHVKYLEGGTGDTLLLIHGFTGDKDNWSRLCKYLTPHFHVISMDLPGFGKSSTVLDGDYTISSQVKRVKSFASALDLKSFHMVGVSMGGYIAGIYASEYPNDLKSLLLIAPLGVNSAKPSLFDQKINAGEPNITLASDREEYDQFLDFVFYKKPFLPLPYKKELARIAIENRSRYEKIFEQGYRPKDVPSLENALIKLPLPTHIVWGREDNMLHVSGAEILGNIIPVSRVNLMDNIGHMPVMENPGETADLFLDFQNTLETK